MVVPICNLIYVICICNQIDFGHNRLRMDQDLPLTVQDGCTAGNPLHPVEGAAGPAPHPVRPRHLRQTNL